MMKKIRQGVLIFGDILLAGASLILTLKLGFWERFSWEIFYNHLGPFSLLYFFWLLIFYVFGLYDLNLIRPKFEFLTRTGECLIVCFLLGLGFFYLIPLFEISPKTNLFINIVVLGILLTAWRRSFYHLFSFYIVRRVAILGKNSSAEKLALSLKNNPQLGYRVVKFLEAEEKIYPQIKRNKIDTLIIATNLGKKPKLTQNLYRCLNLKIDFMDLSRAYEVLLQKIPIDFVSQSWFLENLSEGEKKTYDKLKRARDAVIAALVIGVTSPLWLIFALLIKKGDKGPVFYKQKRVGKDREIFWLWKFRSMVQGAEKREAKWAEKDDPRITKVGRVLRKSHLDELPQLISVLKGSLSLVGPRPERPEFVSNLEKEIPHYHLRHIIKPGITGWAQINFRYARSVSDSHQKFQFDLYYIKNRSSALDLGILLKTFQLFFKKD